MANLTVKGKMIDKDQRIKTLSIGSCGILTCELCEEFHENKIGAAEWLLRRTAIWISDYAEDVPNYGEDRFKKENGFDLKEFVKGLFWYKKMEQGCSGCKGCKISECLKEHGKQSCFECDDYPSCQNMEDLRYKYPFNDDHYKFVQQKGYVKYKEKLMEFVKSGKRVLDLKRIPWRKLYEKFLKDDNMDAFELWRQYYRKRDESV